jgi:hypothetical protein
MRRFLLAASALAVAVGAPLGAQQSVINTPSFSDDLALSGLGAGPYGIPTIGQTFTVPIGATTLTNFSFYLANDANFGGGSELLYKPYLMVWSVDHPTGLNLLSSPLTHTGNSTSDFLQYTFSAGTSVTPGDVYVAFLSTAGISQSGNGYNQFAGTTSSYSGGQLVYAFTSPDGSDLTSPSTWGDGAGAQLGFDAEFTSGTSTVPEPSEFLLIATGLTTLAGSVRFRRRRVTG